MTSTSTNQPAGPSADSEPLLELQRICAALFTVYAAASGGRDRTEEVRGPEIPELRAIEAEAEAAWEAMVEKIVATPARSIAGLVVKLQLSQQEIIGRGSFGMVESVLADAERLAREVHS
jgi:hypothetical protein